MRSYLPAYDMQTPGSLSVALERIAAEPGVWRPFAGGTDLMVLLEAGKLAHRKFLNIFGLAELREITVNPEVVTLGALTTYTHIRRSEILSREFPLLGRAASETGSVATQNRGTIGGNIANGSPAADTPPALLVYDAEIDLVSVHGIRTVPFAQFYSGYKQMDLQDDELVRSIRLPRRPAQREAIEKQYYRKVGTRRAQAISKVCFAGRILMNGGAIVDARIALGSVGPACLRALKTEEFLHGQKLSQASIREAQDELAAEIAPIDDMRSSAVYRKRVAQNLLAEFLEMVSA